MKKSSTPKSSIPTDGAVVYGITNCDTVKKARGWLDERGQGYEFHDFKKNGVPEAELDRWISELGWEKLVNRQGNTWRKLDDAARAAVVDAASAKALMLAQPSVIKRPVVRWGGEKGRHSVGFQVKAWDKLLALMSAAMAAVVVWASAANGPVGALASLAALSAVAPAALAQAPAEQIRLRGTIEKVEPGSITLKERNGETLVLALPANVGLSEVVPIALEDIKQGSYIGTGAMPQADGTLMALEVLVFPESSRGTGEGHRPFDLLPQSTMTNATVADLAAAPSGRRLVLKYKDGEKVVIVPPGTPVVTVKPGDASLVVVGAKVFATAQMVNGKPTVLRMSLGRNGFAPPM